MRQILTMLAMLVALFTFSSVAQAAVGASISPNNIENGGTITVTMTGLEPNTTYTVQFLGVGVDPYGVKSNAPRQVTTNANGEVSWQETIAWGANTYATAVDFSTGGSYGSTSSGTLTVRP